MALPDERNPDALVILHLLAGRHYNRRQLESVAKGVPMLQLKESWLYRELAAEDIAKGEARGIAKGVAQGVTQGVAQGKLEAERDLCLKLVKKHYPALLKRATRRIEACTDYPLPPPSEIPKAGTRICAEPRGFARIQIRGLQRKSASRRISGFS